MRAPYSLISTMKKSISMAVAAAALALTAACVSVDVKKDSFPMGVILPTDNPKFAELSKSVLEGMEIAREKVNGAGGINGRNLDIIARPCGKEAYETSKQISALLDAGVKAIHFGFDNQSVFLQDDLNPVADILVNYLSAYPPATVINTNSVRIFLNGAQESEIMASGIKREPGVEARIVIMHVDDTFGKGSGDYLAFESRLADTKLYKDVYRREEKSFEIFASQLVRLRAEYFLNYGYGDEVEKILKALANADFTGTFISSCPYMPLSVTPPKGVDVYILQTYFEQGKISNQESKSFVAAYKAKYGKSPNFAAAYGYDSVMLFARAFTAANGDAVKAREYLLDKSFECAIGKITFDKQGDTKSELSLVKK